VLKIDVQQIVERFGSDQLEYLLREKVYLIKNFVNKGIFKPNTGDNIHHIVCFLTGPDFNGERALKFMQDLNKTYLMRDNEIFLVFHKS
jgi:hypothetical protein